jgi:hypothetical protein
MKKLIPTISKMAMGGEPPKGVKPIYVSSKNDPRLKSYQDSLSLYKESPPPTKGSKLVPYDWRKAIINTDNFNKDGVRISIPVTQLNRPKIEPIGFYNNDKIFHTILKGQIVAQRNLPYYKKPVQPVEYRQAVTPTIVPKPKVTPKPIVKTTPKPVVSTKKIQMETTPINKRVLMETSKLDTTPINDRTLQMETTKLDSTPVNSKRLQMLTTKLDTINNKRKLQMQTNKIQ